MKKILTLLCALMLSGIAFSQTRTLQAVAYRGAFEPNAARWTDGWTNFNPNAANYDSIQTARGAAITVTGSITKNTTWSSNKVYILNGPVYVKNGITLTIQPGCLIRGNNSAANSCLIISRGARINAVGTVSNPIVFTSSKGNGQRNLGDWGGVIILGKAKNNAVGGVSNIEGLAASADNEFGGNDDDDNSGSLAYCRIEFGGFIFSPDKEINGLTMGSVGRRTRIDHIQVSFTNDDAFEWFGGTVNCTNLVAYQNLDDDMDTDLGYSGTVQFALVVRNKAYFDPSNNSTSEGFESDGDPIGGSAQASLTPKTNAVFSNITLVGPYRNDINQTINSKFERALRIRRNSNLRVFNSVFTDFKDGLHFDGDLCADNSIAAASAANSAACRYNVFASIKNKQDGKPIRNNTRYQAQSPSIAIASTDSLFDAWNNTYFNDNSNGLFADNMTQSNFDMDYRPGASSPLASGANFTDAFIEPRTRIGLGSVNITQDTIEIGNVSSATSIALTVGSIANADEYNWSVPKGVTIVSGQGLTTLNVTFDDPAKFATTIAKPAYIYCQAKNNASNTFSTRDSVRIAKTKPNFRIVALTSNANNNLADGIWSSSTTAAAAINQKTVTVSSTVGLTVGSVVKIIPGTGAGAIGNNNTVASILNSTQFTLASNITTALVSGVVLKAYYFPQGTSAVYTSAAGASSVGTLVTVSSTTGLKEGMSVAVTAGTGTLRAGTVVAKVINGTTFVLSLAPSVALSGASAVISAYPIVLNTCPISVSSGFTSEVDITVVAPSASNIIGYRFDAPLTARISRVGSNLQPDYKTNRLGTILTSATNIGLVFDSTFTSGTIKVTPYNNAGLGTAISVKISKLKTGIFKVTSSAAAIKNTTVLYTAQLANGDLATSYKWTIPSNTTALSGSVVGNVVTTSSDTLSLSFNNSFKSGSLKIEAINDCGTGTAKTFTLNGTTTLTKNGLFELVEENTEVELDNSLNIFPNPNLGSFKVAVNTESTSNATVSVLNLVGQVIYTSEVINSNGLIYAEINENLKKGVYLVKVEIDGDIKINKVIVD